MRIAFSGTHRTGKTTLAQRVAEKMHLPFIPMEVAKMPVWENSGISPSDAKSITFSERVAVQFQVLDYMENVLKSMNETNPNGFVTDRSPIDVFAYLLAGVDGTCGRLYDHDVRAMEIECRNFREYLDLVYIVPMLPFGTSKTAEAGKSGKVYDSYAYQLLVDSIIRSVSSGLQGVMDIPEILVGSESRANWIYSQNVIFDLGE